MLARWLHGRRGVVLVGVTAIAGAIAGVYVSQAVYNRNQPSVTAQCTQTLAIAARVDPFVTGELAAFRVADTPAVIDGGDFDLVLTDGVGQPTGGLMVAGAQR